MPQIGDLRGGLVNASQHGQRDEPGVQFGFHKNQNLVYLIWIMLCSLRLYAPAIDKNCKLNVASDHANFFGNVLVEDFLHGQGDDDFVAALEERFDLLQGVR